MLNDATARDWQRAATQWTGGKNFEGTMPIGPELVTTDEADVSDAVLDHDAERRGHAVGTHLPDDRRYPQRDRQSLPVHPPPPGGRTRSLPGRPAASASRGQPPVWLQPGDVIEVTVEGVGTILTGVIAEETDLSGWKWRPPGSTNVGF